MLNHLFIFDFLNIFFLERHNGIGANTLVVENSETGMSTCDNRVCVQ